MCFERTIAFNLGNVEKMESDGFNPHTGLSRAKVTVHMLLEHIKEEILRGFEMFLHVSLIIRSS